MASRKNVQEGKEFAYDPGLVVSNRAEIEALKQRVQALERMTGYDTEMGRMVKREGRVLLSYVGQLKAKVGFRG